MLICKLCRQNVEPTPEGYCPGCAQHFEELDSSTSETGLANADSERTRPKRPLGVSIIGWLNLLLPLPFLVIFGTLLVAGSASGSELLSYQIWFVSLLIHGAVAAGLLWGSSKVRYLFLLSGPLSVMLRSFKYGFGFEVIFTVILYTVYFVVLTSRPANNYFGRLGVSGETSETNYRPWESAKT